MNRLPLLSVLAFAAFSVSPARSHAQTQRVVEVHEGRTIDDLKPGARLRIVLEATDPADRVQGRLKGFGSTSLILDVNGSSRDLPMSSILVLEESYRDRKRGALVGVLTAIVGVYVWDFFGPHPRYTDQDKRYRENVEALLAGMAGGVLIGGGIGWHRWRTINTR